MRVRLTIENTGFPLFMVVDMPAPPVVGQVIRFPDGADRHVESVMYQLQDGTYEADLRESEYDKAIHTDPKSHRAHLDAMREHGWTITNEELLLRSLDKRVSGQ